MSRHPYNHFCKDKPADAELDLDEAWGENGFGESRQRARLQATLDWLQSGVEAHLRLLVDLLGLSFTEP